MLESMPTQRRPSWWLVSDPKAIDVKHGIAEATE